MSSESLSNDQGPANHRRSLIGRLVTPILILVMILIIAALVARRGGETEDTATVRPPRAIAVELAPVAATTLQDTLRGVGTLNPFQTVEIRPEVNGRILRMNFEEGRFVDQNQVLFELEDEKTSMRFEAHQAALASTRVRLENLRRNYERTASLRERDMVPEEQYDRARTELQAVSADVERLEAELALAGRALEDTIIRAPFDGYISRQLIDPGTFVTVGEPLAIIYEIDPLQITFYVPEKYAGRVERGQDVYASLTAYPNRQFKGQVDFISPVADPGTRNFRVRANIDNPDNLLMPGSFASTELVLARREDRPVIPEQSLVPTRDGYIVYVVEKESSTAHIRQVRTGIREGGRVEINRGLSPGEMVVVYGHMQLDDGSTVNIVQSWDTNWPETEREVD
jgi:membrane fusion protein, multidrug efflux system